MCKLAGKLNLPFCPPVCPEKMARFPRVFSVFGIGFRSMYWKVLKVELFLGFSWFGVGGSGPVVFLPLVNYFLRLLEKFPLENVLP